jgi:hypothetical protein
MGVAGLQSEKMQKIGCENQPKIRKFFKIIFNRFKNAVMELGASF